MIRSLNTIYSNLWEIPADLSVLSRVYSLYPWLLTFLTNSANIWNKGSTQLIQVYPTDRQYLLIV